MNYTERFHPGLAQKVRETPSELPELVIEPATSWFDLPEATEIYSPASPREEEPTPVFASVPQQRTLNSLASPGHAIPNLYETPPPSVPPVEIERVPRHEARHMRTRRVFGENVVRKCARVVKIRQQHTVEELV